MLGLYQSVPVQTLARVCHLSSKLGYAFEEIHETSSIVQSIAFNNLCVWRKKDEIHNYSFGFSICALAIFCSPVLEISCYK